jgi:GT2 family glycosyltransferase
LSDPRVIVAIPTLEAGPALLECLASLACQTERGFEVVVVDNSGKGLVRASDAASFGVRIIEQQRNVGFGAAINAAFRGAAAPYLATINDDAVAEPGWLGALLRSAEAHPKAGMWASSIVLAGLGSLDSAGMLVCADGSSKQRGHFEPPERFATEEEVLLPSGCAALYRREMIDAVGLFDEDFFLYCEDTDLGLRARRAGWTCIYVPGARVEHRYSQTAGRASPLKAYYVERNRLRVALKNFPVRALAGVPAAELARYFWHAVSVVEGKGSAARYQQDNHGVFDLAFIVLRAHCSALFRAPGLWRKRRRIGAKAKLTPAEFRALLERFSISPREVAAL